MEGRDRARSDQEELVARVLQNHINSNSESSRHAPRARQRPTDEHRRQVAARNQHILAASAASEAYDSAQLNSPAVESSRRLRELAIWREHQLQAAQVHEARRLHAQLHEIQLQEAAVREARYLDRGSYLTVQDGNNPLLVYLPGETSLASRATRDPPVVLDLTGDEEEGDNANAVEHQAASTNRLEQGETESIESSQARNRRGAAAAVGTDHYDPIVEIKRKLQESEASARSYSSRTGDGQGHELERRIREANESIAAAAARTQETRNQITQAASPSAKQEKGMKELAERLVTPTSQHRQCSVTLSTEQLDLLGERVREEISSIVYKRDQYIQKLREDIKQLRRGRKAPPRQACDDSPIDGKISYKKEQDDIKRQHQRALRSYLKATAHAFDQMYAGAPSKKRAKREATSTYKR